MDLDVSEANDAGGQAEERLVHVVAAFPADAQTSHSVVPGDGALDDPPDHAEPGTMVGSALGDLRSDPDVPQLVAVFGGIVGAVGVERIGPSARVSAPAAYRRERPHPRGGLGGGADVSARPAG